MPDTFTLHISVFVTSAYMSSTRIRMAFKSTLAKANLEVYILVVKFTQSTYFTVGIARTNIRLFLWEQAEGRPADALMQYTSCSTFVSRRAWIYISQTKTKSHCFDQHGQGRAQLQGRRRTKLRRCSGITKMGFLSFAAERKRVQAEK